MSTVPRIYVASLSDYNAGRLHGIWIDLDADLDDVWDAVRSMLAASPEGDAEEFAIHDYEGFAPVRIDEYENLETVVKVAHGINAHGEAYACWADDLGSHNWDELDNFENVYTGTYETLRDYAEELLDAFGIDPDPNSWAPELLAPYVRVDLDAFAEGLRDIEHICEGPTRIHVFAP